MTREQIEARREQINELESQLLGMNGSSPETVTRIVEQADWYAGVDARAGLAYFLAESWPTIRAALHGNAQSPAPVAWQYRVMFDATHSRRDEWCEWHDTSEKYFNKVNVEIAAGATRVQTRALYALVSSTDQTHTEKTGE